MPRFCLESAVVGCLRLPVTLGTGAFLLAAIMDCMAIIGGGSVAPHSSHTVTDALVQSSVHRGQARASMQRKEGGGVRAYRDWGQRGGRVGFLG